MSFQLYTDIQGKILHHFKILWYVTWKRWVIKNTHKYICGDININLLRYSSNSNVKYYVDSINIVNCISIIDKPTRITPTSRTLIDHIYSNDMEK